MLRSGVLLLSLALSLGATTYYVDANEGKDTNAGTLQSAPWQSLNKVNTTVLQPGDRVLLRAGRVWRGALIPQGSGTPEAPVIISRYGSGPRPRIDGEGQVENTVLLRNVQGFELRDLEITNHGSEVKKRRGVNLVLEDYGVAKHIVIAGLYIHDVNGNNDKDNGGIIFHTRGDKKPTRVEGLSIERNIIWKVDRSGIAFSSTHWNRLKWNPHQKVVIRDNYVEDIGGDGIVPWASDGALIEHNIAVRCRQRSPDYNAGIWPWSTDNSVFRLNEASFTKGTKDGQGFDSDYNSHNTLFEYNYSHDNDGGFILICAPGDRDRRQDVGNIGTIVRRNISRNDKERVFHISAVKDTRIEENAIYTGAGIDVQMVLFGNWNGWAEKTLFRSNLFYAEGTARYGHESKRFGEGRSQIAKGWGPAKEVVFEGNRYFGNHVDRPSDERGAVEESGKMPKLDWNGPKFDPAQPDTFDAYLKQHRAWLVKLMRSQFGDKFTLQ